MSYPDCVNQFRSYFIVICSFVIFSAHSDVPRPRGVSLAKAPLYSATKDFTCFDGLVTIPFAYVNDDYCDCFDGSDEPGTPACLNGVFHCTNAGHISQNVPTSRVNDGVCDCCDGTDEYNAPDACPNTCEELGKEARAEAQRLAELHKAGSQIRAEMIEQGNKKRSEMAEHLSQLENDLSEAEKIKTEKEALKNEIESRENEVLQIYREAEEREKQEKAEEERLKNEKEAMDHFSRFDSNYDGVLSVDEVKVVNVFDKDKNGEVDDEEYKYFFNDLTNVDKDTFMSTAWPLLKPFLMMEQGMFRPAEQVEDTDHHDEEDQHEEDENSELDDNVDDVQEDEHELELEPEPTKGYDEETQKIVDEATEARKQHSDAERTVREIESTIKNIQQNLEKDYGLQQEFATLDGQCFEYDDREYTYRLCMFDKVTQKSKNSGSEVGLGNWGEWSGEDPFRYSAMKYVNGVTCWNGPSRSTLVNIHCGLETKLLSVTEPYRCEYKIELTTPAACDTTYAQHLAHDEL